MAQNERVDPMAGRVRPPRLSNQEPLARERVSIRADETRGMTKSREVVREATFGGGLRHFAGDALSILLPFLLLFPSANVDNFSRGSPESVRGSLCLRLGYALNINVNSSSVEHVKLISPHQLVSGNSLKCSSKICLSLLSYLLKG